MCFNARMKTFFCIAWVVVAAAGSGCLSPVDDAGRLRHRRIEVSLSGLDWMEISYYPADDNPRIPEACRLSLFGAGEVIFKTGRSPQIWDSFSEDVAHPDWNEVYTDRMHLSREEMREVFQAFVDEGLVPSSWPIRRAEPIDKPYVRIVAQIGMEKVRRITDNRNLVDLVEAALENFSPTLERAAASSGGGGQK